MDKPDRRASLHRRERRWRQQHALDVGEDGPVALALGACRDPGGVGLKGGPFFLAVGERFPGDEVMQVVVAIADQHGPEARRLDAMLFPDLDGVVLEALEQGGQAARQTGVETIFVDHGVAHPLWPANSIAWLLSPTPARASCRLRSRPQG